MKTFYKRFRRFPATLLGIVFLVSGILKLWDPVGTMLQVEEYLKFLHMTGLLGAAKGIGIGLSFTESVLGVGLITGVLRKAGAIATYALLGLFTLVTLMLWVKDANMDCGCFGEAIPLSPRTSFLKNVILVVLAIIAFTPFREFGKAKTHRGVAAVMATLAIIVATWYSNTHLPIVDFTPFNWGTRLLASLDEDALEEEYHQAPVLSFCDNGGGYCDELATVGKVIVFSVYDPEDANWERLTDHYRAAAQTEDVLPLLLMPATDDSVPLPPDIHPYYSDYNTLITLNRSNGGGSYFFDGELIHKWSARHFPSNFAKDMADDPIALSTRHVTQRRVTAQGFCVGLAAILILL